MPIDTEPATPSADPRALASPTKLDAANDAAHNAANDTVKMLDDESLHRSSATHATETAMPKRTFGLQSLFWLMQIAAALAAGFWLAKQSNGPDNRIELKTTAATPNTSEVPVTVDRMVVRDIERSIEAVGNLHGYDELTLKTKVSGRVAKIHHDFADKVKPGELLLEIDPTDATLAVEQSKRSLNSELAKWGFKEVPDNKVDLSKLPTVTAARLKADWTKSQLDRLKTLQSRGSVIAEEIEQAKTNQLVAESDYANQLLMARAGAATAQLKKAELAIAEQQLTETKIFLPIPRDVPDDLRYTITDRYVSQGAWLAAGTDLFRLVIDETLKLRLTIPEKYAADVKVGQKVQVATLSQNEPVDGVVARIGPAVDPTTRTFQLEAEVPNKSSVLKTGGFAKARVLIAATTAQTVPVAALVTFAGVHKIFLVNGDQVQEIQVTLGQQTGEWVEIALPPLPTDSVVVTSGQSKLADGSAIRIRKPEEDIAAEPSVAKANESSAGRANATDNANTAAPTQGTEKAAASPNSASEVRTAEMPTRQGASE